MIINELILQIFLSYCWIIYGALDCWSCIKMTKINNNNYENNFDATLKGIIDGIGRHFDNNNWTTLHIDVFLIIQSLDDLTARNNVIGEVSLRVKWISVEVLQNLVSQMKPAHVIIHHNASFEMEFTFIFRGHRLKNISL